MKKIPQPKINALMSLANTQKLAAALLILLVPPTCFAALRPQGLWGALFDNMFYVSGIMLTHSYLTALDYKWRSRWFYLALSALPIGGSLLSLWLLNRKATAALGSAGYKVGILGCDFEPLVEIESEPKEPAPLSPRRSEEPTPAEMSFIRYCILSTI